MAKPKVIVDEEVWDTIAQFPRYQISTEGRIFNFNTNKFMKHSLNNYGHPKISLLNYRGERLTRSVAFLVAKTFLDQPNILCDRIVYLNGDHSDVRAANLAWRPRWFCWKYARQLKIDQPHYYRNLPVLDATEDLEYENIIQAGMANGLLFDHIWHSTYTGDPVFPDGSIWEILERV